MGAYQLLYDAENRQKQSTDSATGAIVRYQYDGDGRRVEKTLGSNDTVYVYDAFGQLAAEYANGSAGTPPCQTCYLSTDHLGNTRLVTDSSANVIARHDFTPFGEEIPAGSAARTTQWGAFDGVRQKFTGQEHDDETQFDFFQTRYLSSAQQRFMSPDPGNAGADLMNPQSWNAYAYVLNSPLSNVDPTGQDVEHLGNCFFNYYLDPEDGSKHYGSTVCIAPGDGTGGGDQQTTPPPPVKFTVTVTANPPNSGTARALATCAASKASSFANLLGLAKDNFWAQAFLGNDFSTAANLLLGNDRGANGPAALLSNPTPINATSIALSAIGKKVVGTGGLVVKETPGGAPYAATKFLPIAETVGGKVLFKGIAAFSAAKLVYDGAAFGYAELQCAGVVQ